MFLQFKQPNPPDAWGQKKYFEGRVKVSKTQLAKFTRWENRSASTNTGRVKTLFVFKFENWGGTSPIMDGQEAGTINQIFLR